MRSIAREMGLTAPALYRHFRSKEELVAAAIERGFGRFTSTLTQALARPTPGARLRASRGAILEFALRQPRLYETLAYPGDEPDVKALVQHLHVEVRAVSQFLQDRVSECMEAGVPIQDDPRKMALVLWSFSHGLLVAYLSGHLGIDEAQLRDLYWECGDRTIRGILCS